jgi:hypothetical protein
LIGGESCPQFTAGKTEQQFRGADKSLISTTERERARPRGHRESPAKTNAAVAAASLAGSVATTPDEVAKIAASQTKNAASPPRF